jgi:hypothetical protein
MGIIQRFIGVVLGLLFVAATLVFASLALGVLLALGLVVWGWLLWRTRSTPASGAGCDRGRVPDLTCEGASSRGPLAVMLP